jgi:hypothetical protein
MEYGLLKFSHILGAVLSAPGLSAFGWPTSARASSASLSRSQHSNTLQQWALHGRFSVWQLATKPAPLGALLRLKIRDESAKPH